MNEIKRIELYLTYRCNRSCVYCFAKDRRNSQSYQIDIDFKTISNTLYSGKKNGFNYLTLVDGEPTIHKDFIKTLLLAKKLVYYIHIFTNGLAFSDEKFTKIVSEIQVDSLALNIPDYREKEYEFLTGFKNSYKTMIKAVNNIIEAKIPLSSIFIVNDLN
ncbi:MAG: radical SAM protein [Elusimicrobiota bacterium]